MKTKHQNVYFPLTHFFCIVLAAIAVDAATVFVAIVVSIIVSAPSMYSLLLLPPSSWLFSMSFQEKAATALS